MTVYEENGFEDREDYLEYLADTYGKNIGDVKTIADALGEDEDFDGLVSMLQDM